MAPSGPVPLIERVDALVVEVAHRYADAGRDAVVERLATIRHRLHEPLRVAIAGKLKSGKSTLLNALVGEVMAPTDASECTRVVTWYQDGLSYRATVEPRSGAPREVLLRRYPDGVEIDLDGLPAEAVERVVVEWPSSALRSMTLIDTPGVGSLSGVGERTSLFLAPADELPSPADAVVYLTKHVHRSDVGFLEAFHDADGARATPVNAIGVLSRADEIGGGRLDSLASAARIAARTRRDPTVRRLCLTIVPVAGLLAQAAATLTEAEFQALRRIALAPDEDADALLLSVDRFAREDGTGLGLAPAERARLVERFGLFGLRLARELLRLDPDRSARMLSEELRRRSGLDELRALLTVSFAARRDALKSRSALAALGELLRNERLDDDSGGELLGRLESVRASAHELTELRVLLAVRTGEVGLDDAAVAEIEQLFTAAAPADRLGLGDADDAATRAAIVAGVARWRARAEQPLASPQTVDISLAVARTLEGMLVSPGP